MLSCGIYIMREGSTDRKEGIYVGSGRTFEQLRIECVEMMMMITAWQRPGGIVLYCIEDHTNDT